MRASSTGVSRSTTKPSRRTPCSLNTARLVAHVFWISISHSSPNKLEPGNFKDRMEIKTRDCR